MKDRDRLLTVGLVAGAGVGATLVGLAGIWIARTHVVVTVGGNSMMPALAAGDRVVVRRCKPQRIHRGDIVVIAPPDAVRSPPSSGSRREPEGGWVVKRVAALPGDPVPFAVMPATLPDSVVPPARLVVVGDGACSIDSRQLGFFSDDALLGRVQRRLVRTNDP
jgi:signal peptidase I